MKRDQQRARSVIFRHVEHAVAAAVTVTEVERVQAPGSG